MEDIKFKGYSKKLNKWVYGDLDTNCGKKDFYKINSWSLCESIEVEPKSIGQYTGLKDSKGKEIYEGDIIKIKNDNEGYGLIKYEKGCFGVEWFYDKQIDNGLFINFYEIINKKHFIIMPNIEIIGNIYQK